MSARDFQASCAAEEKKQLLQEMLDYRKEVSGETNGSLDYF